MNSVYKFLKVLLFTAALAGPVVRVVSAADVKVYVDSKHHDKHEWNEDEDRRYRAYMEEHHRKYIEFHKLNRRDQEAYWEWRHQH
jgi:hypothetical protein